METYQDTIMADTIMTPTKNSPSVNSTTRWGRESTCVSSPEKDMMITPPHSPSSPFAEILRVRLRQVQPCSKEEYTEDDFASAIDAGRQFQLEERYDDAIISYRKALLCKNKSIAMESRSVQLTFASTLFEVGMIHSYSQYKDPMKAAQALQAFELCLQMSRACLGEDHPSVARVLYETGVIIESTGDPEEALAHFSEAIAILLSNPMDAHLKTLWMSLSRVQILLGQTEDAQSSLKEAEKL
jgi:tetratricopeptide (TPR) repeat protein